MSKQRESNAVHREMWRKFVRTINDLEAEIEQTEKQKIQCENCVASEAKVETARGLLKRAGKGRKR